MKVTTCFLHWNPLSRKMSTWREDAARVVALLNSGATQAQALTAMRAERDSLLFSVEQLKIWLRDKEQALKEAEASNAAYRIALEDLRRNGRLGDHSHWDREGNSGRTCPVCIDQRRASDAAKAVLVSHAEAGRTTPFDDIEKSVHPTVRQKDADESAASEEKHLYTIILSRDNEGDVIARIPELEGCISHGETEQHALENILDVKQLFLDDGATFSALPKDVTSFSASEGPMPLERDPCKCSTPVWRWDYDLCSNCSGTLPTGPTAQEIADLKGQLEAVTEALKRAEWLIARDLARFECHRMEISNTAEEIQAEVRAALAKIGAKP
jgi:predicted RNase H-like HicB family nuclease